MKRCIKNFLLLTTITAITACEKGTPQMPDSGNAINFGIEWQQDSNDLWSKTKASQISESTIDNFGVFAYYDADGSFSSTASTPNYMNNIKVNKDGADNWSYSPIEVWPNTGSLSFFAYSPYNSSNLTVAATTGKPEFTYSIPENVTDQQDLLISEPLINETKPLPGEKTLITLQHALACIDFTGSVASEMGDPVKITKVEILGLKKDGEFSFNNDNSLKTSEQANVNSYTLNATNGALNEVDIKDVLETQKSKVSILTTNGYPMIIPQSVSADAKIKVTIASGNPATEEIITSNLSALISQFESGKRYRINIQIASPTTDVTITATVQPWKTATVNVPSFN